MKMKNEKEIISELLKSAKSINTLLHQSMREKNCKIETVHKYMKSFSKVIEAVSVLEKKQTNN